MHVMKFSETPFDAHFFARRRKLLRFAGTGAATLLLTPSLAQAQAWRQSKAVLDSVGSAPVSQDGLQINLPLVAEDGSSVPLGISSDRLSGSSRIERLEIFAPGNPTPEVAVFEFGPEIEQVNLATRIRLSESQTVVAVARGADGKVHVAERAVRVTTSGCIAPAQSDPSSEMNARVRVPKSWKSGMPAEVLTMISHPMTTGLAQDASGKTPPMRIINQFEASLEGRSLVSARFFRSLAANPYLKFDMTPSQNGELRFQWTEDTGRAVRHTENIRIA